MCVCVHSQVDYNERRLSQLDAEKKDAVKRSAIASEAEKLLVSELDEARTILMAHEAKQRQVGAIVIRCPSVCTFLSLYLCGISFSVTSFIRLLKYFSGIRTCTYIRTGSE